MQTPHACGGAFRDLWIFDRDAYAAHLSRLTDEDRQSRFRHAISDDRLLDHAGSALSGRTHVIGWFADATLRAAAEVTLSPDGATAEAAFEVEEDWRGRGVGSELVRRTLLWARNRGVKRVVIHTTRRNVAMLKAATRQGAAFEFDLSEAEGIVAPPGPTLRSHMEEAALAQSGRWQWMFAAMARRLPWLPASPGKV
jgi:GNAT superfamily N-acetyltransferase